MDADRVSRVVPELVTAALAGPDAIHLQPIVARDGTLVAVEALARYRAGSPDEVFAAADAAGHRVTAELAAARAAVAHTGTVAAAVRLSVNVSADTLANPDASEVLVPVASRLWVEVTEVAPVRPASRALRTAGALRRAGALIVADDVGAAFATARQVQLLAAEVIKLDRGLVRRAVDGDADAVAQVTDLVDLAGALGSRVVAEGVEDDADIDAVTRLGADLLQGWAVGRPRPV